MTLPPIVAKVRDTPAARGRTVPEIVNGAPLLTEVGGFTIRLRETETATGVVADASRSHDGSVTT